MTLVKLRLVAASICPYPTPQSPDTEWLFHVLHEFCGHFAETSFPPHGVSEGWFSHRIWHPIIDRAIDSLPSLKASRGEITCLATRQRMNQLPQKKRVASGLRSDAIFHENTVDRIEYGVMEVSPCYDRGVGAKWKTDRQKLIRTMRDLIVSIHQKYNNDSLIRKIQVVGILAGGFHCQFYRMIWAEGDTCLLIPGQTFEVPTSVGKLSEIVPLLHAVHQYRLSETVIRERGLSSTDTVSTQISWPWSMFSDG